MTAAKSVVSPRRRSLLAKVHIAKKALGLDDALYRDILSGRYGKASASQLSDRRLVDLVNYFKSQGFKPTRKVRHIRKAEARPAASHEAAKKMRALWLSLYHLGVVRDPSETALTAWARRVTGGPETGLASLTWIKGHDAFKVIEGLKKMAEREARVDWSAECPRRAVIKAQLRELGHLSDMDLLKQVRALSAYLNEEQLSDEMLSGLIEDMGPLVREVKSHKQACQVK